MRAIAAAVIASVALVGVYVGLGGGDYEPSAPPDPCAIQAEPGNDGVDGAFERIGLNALAGAACELGVSRERLLLSLTGEEDIGVDSERRADAFRAGLRAAVDEEQEAGRLGAAEAFLIRQGINFVPVEELLDRLFGEGL